MAFEDDDFRATISTPSGDEGHFLSLTADVNSRTWTVTKNKETGEVTGTHSIKLKVA